jgi:hypothetical protein
MLDIDKIFKKFAIMAFVFAFLLVAIGYIVFFIIKPELFNLAMPIMLLYVLAITLLSHNKMLKSLEKRAMVFVNIFMMFTGIKLLSYLVFITIVALITTKNLIPFVASFFVVYLVFTIFETTSILKYSKKDNFINQNNTQ